MAEAARVLPEERRTIVVTNPATLEKVTEIPVTDADGVRDAVARARRAQKDWAALSFDERAEALYRFREKVLDNADRFADLLTSETGKPRGDAWSVELLYVCDALSYWAKNAETFLEETRVTPHLLKNKKAWSTYHPLGVVGIIGPWNFPFVLTIGDALPALMAGNAVVVKPSEITPQTALFGAEMWREAGLPADVLQVLPGYGETGAELVEHVDMIMFTGSVATGRKVAMRAAERLIPSSLELGGNDATIVCSDADLERAANACAWGGFVNSGQVCLSVERIYAEAPIHDAFVEKVHEKVAAIRQGLSSDPDVDIGSMTFPKQIEIVQAHIEDAVAKGARLVLGGKRNDSLPGLFWHPTILADVTGEMDVMKHETFGPVIAIQKVADVEEAIRLANDSNYGLGGSVFTKDHEKGRAIARRMEAGGISVNDCLVHFSVTDVPMGGIKESGLGRRHGADGIRKYSRQQTIVADRFGAKSEAFWFPNSAKKNRLIRRVTNLLFRRDWRKKLFG